MFCTLPLLLFLEFYLLAFTLHPVFPLIAPAAAEINWSVFSGLIWEDDPNYVTDQWWGVKWHHDWIWGNIYSRTHHGSMFGHSWMLFHVYQFYQIVCPAFIVMTCLGMRYYSSYFTMIIWSSGALTTGCVNLPPPHPHTWVQASQADPCPAPQHTWDFIAAFLTFIIPCQGLAWSL